MTVFEEFAKYYDLIYNDKDYEKECDFLEEAFKRFAKEKPKRILDVGCGTGSHLASLLRRGYEVTGIDASRSMVRLAQKKVHDNNWSATIHLMDIRDASLDDKFDATICMFSVLGYLTEDDDLRRALRSIRRHLRKNGLFVLDFWYGPAVLAIKPSVAMKKIEAGSLRLLRIGQPKLEAFHNLCKVSYTLIASKDDRIVDRIEETHAMRYFFPRELVHSLTENGFQTLKFCEFPHIENPVSEHTWNVALIARASDQREL